MGESLANAGVFSLGQRPNGCLARGDAATLLHVHLTQYDRPSYDDQQDRQDGPQEGTADGRSPAAPLSTAGVSQPNKEAGHDEPAPFVFIVGPSRLAGPDIPCRF